MRTRTSGWYLAACLRGTYFSLALLSEETVLEIRRHRVIGQRRGQLHLSALLRALASDYAIETVIVEPNTLAHAAAGMTDLKVQTLTLGQAKEQLLTRKRRQRTIAALSQEVLRYRPELNRLIGFMPTNNRVTIECSKTVSLLSVALGLAAPTIDQSQLIQ